MIAVDTNVVVRFLVWDDEAQGQRARQVILSGGVLVPRTVLMEVEWVLRLAYRMERAAIGAALEAFLGIPGVVPEDADQVLRALTWYIGGLDFADAMHLAASGGTQGFVTFDVALRRGASRFADTVPVAAP